MMPRRHSGLVRAVYRALWRLYPQSFRDRFEESAAEVFQARYEEESKRGWLPLGLFWLRTIGNVAIHGTVERLASMRVLGADAAEG